MEVYNYFVKHLIHEVVHLNQEADWNDFYYTQLEAEVEVDHLADLNSGRLMMRRGSWVM